MLRQAFRRKARLFHVPQERGQPFRQAGSVRRPLIILELIPLRQQRPAQGHGPSAPIQHPLGRAAAPLKHVPPQPRGRQHLHIHQSRQVQPVHDFPLHEQGELLGHQHQHPFPCLPRLSDLPQHQRCQTSGPARKDFDPHASASPPPFHYAIAGQGAERETGLVFPPGTCYAMYRFQHHDNARKDDSHENRAFE